MDRLNRAAVVTRFAGELRAAGSWCGETHIQKGVYLLQDLLGVPTDFLFVLYKHGPFSFDLSDELTALRGDQLLALEVQPPPYGPRYARTQRSDRLEEAYGPTVAAFQDDLRYVSRVIGDRTVAQLERLATALYVTRQTNFGHDGSVQSRAECIHRLKPHVPVAAAAEAVAEIDQLSAQVQANKKPLVG
ncbi:MAG: hypothetical protein ACLQNE_46015 [Thermoguttaceae bacterium]